jgi:isopenicillin N synthase-like dioxygenase
MQESENLNKCVQGELGLDLMEALRVLQGKTGKRHRVDRRMELSWERYGFTQVVNHSHAVREFRR